MKGRDRGLDLVGTGAPEGPRLLDQPPGRRDRLPVPGAAVLVAQQDQAAPAVEAAARPRQVEPHQRQQPDRLWLFG